MRPADDIEAAMTRHGDTVWRVCLLALRRFADAQDAFQDTFMKYALADDTDFRSDEHRRAWLIRVATNRCRDMQRSGAWKALARESADDLAQTASTDPEAQPDSPIREVLDAMDALADPPRTPVYLALYEGYTAPEIASMLEAPVGTVYSWISRGKALLKEALR